MELLGGRDQWHACMQHCTNRAILLPVQVVVYERYVCKLFLITELGLELGSLGLRIFLKL